MTLSVAFSLHSPQTGVCPLHAGTYIFPDTTLSVAIHLPSNQTRVCLLRAGAYLARPLA